MTTGTVLAAAPFEDFARDNAPLLAAMVCALLAVLALRLIVNVMTRTVVLSLLLLVTVFVAAEHEEITECAQTCRCQLAGVETSVAYCNPKLPRTGDDT
jgi:hypothetical protein